jgi:hypothetical protein
MCTGSHPFIPVENTIRVDFVYLTPGGEAENVLFFDFGSAPGFTDVEDVVEAAKDAWVSNIIPIQSRDVMITKVIGTDLTAEASFTTETAPNVAGSVAADAVPQNVTSAIAFRTGFSGRSKRGRMFWIGHVKGNMVGDTLTSTAVTNILAGVNNFIADLEAAIPTLTHVVVSYCHEGAWRLAGDKTLIKDYTLDPTIDSQRRRLAGRGA